MSTQVSIVMIVKDGVSNIGVVLGSDDIFDQGSIGDTAQAFVLAPVLASILGDMDEAVIGTSENQAFLNRTFAESNDRAVHGRGGIFCNTINAPDSPHNLKPVAIDFSGQVRANWLPVFSTIVAAEDSFGSIVEPCWRVRAN